MILTIDIGNSYIKCAVFEQNSIKEKYIFENLEPLKNFKKILKKFPKITGIAISSVGKLENEAYLYLKESLNFLEIDHKTPFPFKNLYETPTTLGIDRMVLSAGAVLLHPKSNKLIIDAGTCITYDFVDKNNNYHGGSISPGITLRYKSLHNYTEKLPLLEKQEVKSFIGKNTNDAIHTGIINGVINEIDGFIKQYLDTHEDLTIILTGGDADFLAKSLKNTIFANSNFLLESLNQLYTYCKKKND